MRIFFIHHIYMRFLSYKEGSFWYIYAILSCSCVSVIDSARKSWSNIQSISEFNASSSLINLPFIRCSYCKFSKSTWWVTGIWESWRCEACPSVIWITSFYISINPFSIFIFIFLYRKRIICPNGFWIIYQYTSIWWSIFLISRSTSPYTRYTKISICSLCICDKFPCWNTSSSEWSKICASDNTTSCWNNSCTSGLKWRGSGIILNIWKSGHNTIKRIYIGLKCINLCL